MRNLKTIYIVFLFGLSLSACTDRDNNKLDNYPKDTKTSKSDGTPNDSLSFYYPASFIGDTSLNQFPLDTFHQNWYSSALYAFKEPILYNYYQGHDKYRFLWLRSFDRPVVFVFNRDKDQVWLTVKLLNKQPNILDEVLVKSQPKNGDKYKIEIIPDSIIKADRKADIVYSRRLDFTMTEWNFFDTLIKSANFWAIPPTVEVTGTDGSEWIIEAHLKDKYRFVQRWVPKDKFKSIGNYLINSSC